ncbi:tumor necrosis factor receptor superfamily member 26-like, partial [Equus quagga]|uniref:tumor necrosis factor receptor superfamily member 26-like n=1 Tax=Equus quagga TaxID=89248 RepID=UPI001EE1CAD4
MQRAQRPGASGPPRAEASGPRSGLCWSRTALGPHLPSVPPAPAGSYVSEHCTVNHSKGQCRECEPGTFTAHPTGMTSCLPCAQCREDQEVVTNCSRVSDRQCQCQQGSFYCDSPDCAEKCFRCTRCQGSVLQPCSATRDTVCAIETNQEPDERLIPSLQGNGNSSEPFIAVAVVVVLFIVVIIVVIIVVYWKKGNLELDESWRKLDQPLCQELR